MNDKEAWASFQKFEVIFQIASKECTSLLANFLCGLYAPSCGDTKNPLPPCQKLCLDVRSECRRAIRNVTKASGFQWPSDLKCRNFPKKDEASCYSGHSDGGDTMIPQNGNVKRCQYIPGGGTLQPPPPTKKRISLSSNLIQNSMPFFRPRLSKNCFLVYIKIMRKALIFVVLIQPHLSRHKE